MKKIYFFILLSFIFQLKEIKAQYVTLPDTNFRNYLIQNFPSCFNGSGQLDTICAAALDSISINTEYLAVGSLDLSGVTYFKKCEALVCPGNNLTSLPALPPNLKVLRCYGNQLTQLPALPKSIYSLICGSNQLTSLPNLPDSLYELECNNNLLDSLPALPLFLEDLDCQYNNIKNLPKLPETLIELICTNNNLYCLPVIPASLTSLQALNNHISCLYDIPYNTSIRLTMDSTYQICNGNNNVHNCPLDSHHVSIPDPYFINYLQDFFPSCFNISGLFDTTCAAVLNVTSVNISTFGINNLTGIQYFKNLDTLTCSNNNLISLPPLPPSLSYLDCSNNLLTSLPDLNGVTIVSGRTSQANSLVSLNCENNQLTCLPILPDGLQSLKATGNHISCIPNLPSSLTSLDSAFQVCNDTNNRNGCTIQQVTGITGASVVQSVDVFPNPSNGLVTINCPFTATGIKICGMDGKTVYETTGSSATYTIDLSGKGKGVYVIQALSANGIVTQKLVLD